MIVLLMNYTVEFEKIDKDFVRNVGLPNRNAIKRKT